MAEYAFLRVRPETRLGILQIRDRLRNSGQIPGDSILDAVDWMVQACDSKLDAMEAKEAKKAAKKEG